jgi:transcriptional regulator with PAS, ATPase and Fis domain
MAAPRPNEGRIDQVAVESGDELNRTNAFLENVLGSFHGGLIVVDGELRVQAWKNRAEDLWGLRSAEVQGKHLMNSTSGFRRKYCVSPSGSACPVNRRFFASRCPP